MNNMQALSYLQAQATTPDQLLSYVSAVSPMQSELINDYIVHSKGTHSVIIAYSLQDAHNTEKLDEVIEIVLKKEICESIAVLAPIRPSIAPEYAISSQKDYYYYVSLPMLKLSDKVKNMLNRAHKEVRITKKSGKEAWTSAHHELMLAYIRDKGMEQGLCSIMQALEKYLLQEEQTMLFSAYAKDSTLLAYAIGDFSSFSTAFYMFAFRNEHTSIKVPGVADAVLFALLQEAEQRGYNKCNLGLGINEGIKFFKTKWNAKPELAFIETKWKIMDSSSVKSKKKSWFSNLFNKEAR